MQTDCFRPVCAFCSFFRRSIRPWRTMMGHSNLDPIETGQAWNVGRKLGAKRPLKPKEIWAVQFVLDQDRKVRDRALFDLAIDSKLRGCDLVKIKIGDLVSGGRVRNRAMVIQQKTRRPVQFEILEPARSSVLAWLERRGGGLEELPEPGRSIRPPQYEAICSTGRRMGVRNWSSPGRLWHPLLRRTKAVLIYKQTGNLRAVEIRSVTPKSRVRSEIPGVDIEDALRSAEGTEV